MKHDVLPAILVIIYLLKYNYIPGILKKCSKIEKNKNVNFSVASGDDSDKSCDDDETEGEDGFSDEEDEEGVGGDDVDQQMEDGEEEEEDAEGDEEEDVRRPLEKSSKTTKPGNT